jgi:hypothetical protein
MSTYHPAFRFLLRRDILRLSANEAPNLIALEPSNAHVSNVLIVELLTRDSKIDKEFRNRV